MLGVVDFTFTDNLGVLNELVLSLLQARRLKVGDKPLLTVSTFMQVI